MAQAAGKLEGVRTIGRRPRGAPGADARQLEFFNSLLGQGDHLKPSHAASPCRDRFVTEPFPISPESKK